MQYDHNNENNQDRKVSKKEVLTEIQEDLDIRQQRRRMFPRAALVGLGAGLVASFFRVVLAGSDAMRNGMIEWSHQFPLLGWIFPLAFSALGAILSVMLVRRYAPETSGSGIPHLEAVLHRLRSLNWKRVLPVKFVAGALAIGGGLALGREGPTVQMGGAIGDAISRWLKVPPRERRTLIAAGAGAGLAAAFNAPLSGVIFVLEEIQRDFHPSVFGAAFLAAAIADIVTRLLSGTFPVFSIPSYSTPPTSSLPVFALLGILAGLLGVAFNRSLLGTMNLFARVKGGWNLALVAGIGAMVGIAGWFSPMAIGSGHSLAETTLAGNLILSAIPIFFIIRFIMTISSYGSGAAGGIFAPLLAIGALLGLAIGQMANQIAPSIVPQPAVFAVVGMAAYFTAIVRAPLTGIVLIVEMTGNYRQMLPLLVACFCAYAIAELLKDLPIYESLLERDLIPDGSHIKLKEPMVIDLVIEQGAPFAGQEVHKLGLPPGCVLVRCIEGGRGFVPTAMTRLEPHMKITAVIAPEAAHGLAILRHGCKGKKSAFGQAHDG
ncbi:MAG: H(+)/Cl(-) exchange transporter ClcA [Anaerolineaceae bacterium]|nr:MAG: H(+)/Cl(-) exchange transporter ClcA [Anaerolineaceae bacterium]